MTDLARIAVRPWLSALGRPGLRTPTTIAPSYVGVRLGLGPSVSVSVSGNARGITSRQHGKHLKDRDAARRKKNDGIAQTDIATTFLLPYTVVPPPVWRYPRSPIAFAKMVWILIKNRAVAFGSLAGVYFMSTPGFFSLPRFRTGKRASIPAAKALHVQMSEAVASGDKDTLRRICTKELFQTLAGVIDSRPRTSTSSSAGAAFRTEWELVRYEDPFLYPRLADFRVTYQPLPGSQSMRIVKQAVVSISSVQRLARFAPDGAEVPGSARERRMLEHIVLQAAIRNNDDFGAEPWKVWGTLSETDYDTIRRDTEMFDGQGGGVQA